MSTDHISIRPACRDDASLVLEFIRGLAEYEKLLDEVSATEKDLAETLFDAGAVAEVLIAEWDGAPAGFALFFPNYSTFLGKPGIYLEDLFVHPEFRGNGIGKSLLARVALLAVQRGGARLDWVVLDWNDPALRFYESIGAKALGDWVHHRLSGDALKRLADRS
jgi:GNAT superfamily N-acetyltransferase